MQSQVRQVKQIYLKYLFYFIDDQMIKTRKPNTTVPMLNRNIKETEVKIDTPKHIYMTDYFPDLENVFQ